MKKLIWVLCAVMLGWNIWLTAELINQNDVVVIPSEEGGTAVIQETLKDYATDITKTVDNNRTHAVSVRSVAGQTEKKASGVIFSRDEETVYILTTSEVLSGSGEAYAVFDNGVELGCEIAGTDPATGLGLLSVQPSFETTPFVLGDSDLLEQGEYVITLGGRRPDTGTGFTSFGISSVSGMRRISPNSFWIAGVIETDAKVPQAVWGGALMDIGGKLAGILIPPPLDAQEGMGYALSINEVKQVFTQLKEDGTVRRGALGVKGRSISAMKAYEKSALGIGLDMNYGIYCADVLNESAASGVIEKGDLLVMLNGSRIESMESLRSMLYTFAEGDAVSLTVIRDEQETELEAVLK